MNVGQALSESYSRSHGSIPPKMSTTLTGNIYKDNFPQSPLAHKVSPRNNIIGVHRNDVMLSM